MRCRMVWRGVIPISSFPHDSPTAILNQAAARMPRLFCQGPAMLMIRSVIAFSFLLVMSTGAVRADDTPAACTVSTVNILAGDQGDVTIACTRLSEVVGRQYADILTRILQDRLDPQMVLDKLDEIDQIPEEGVARSVDEKQHQLILRSLNGKPTGLVSITAHPESGDGAEFAKGIATSLLQAGWQIEGQQIRRVAPPSLESVRGLAIVVHDKGSPPQQAVRLKTALNAAHITAKLLADPNLASDYTLLWIGQRPGLTSAEPAK